MKMEEERLKGSVHERQSLLPFPSIREENYGFHYCMTSMGLSLMKPQGSN